jgi:hypothetical protein
MSDCRVEFKKRIHCRHGGPDRLVLARLTDDFGQTRHLPEAQAKAIARGMARELRTGARVMAAGVEVARFAWHEGRGEVVEVDLGRDVR